MLAHALSELEWQQRVRDFQSAQASRLEGQKKELEVANGLLQDQCADLEWEKGEWVAAHGQLSLDKDALEAAARQLLAEGDRQAAEMAEAYKAQVGLPSRLWGIFISSPPEGGGHHPPAWAVWSATPFHPGGGTTCLQAVATLTGLHTPWLWLFPGGWVTDKFCHGP